jgi:hypothetical protein
MELDTKNRTDTQIYTYIGHNIEELVFGIGNAQRDNKMGGVVLEV